MIPVVLREWGPRFLLLLLAAWVLYLMEPSFHPQEVVDPEVAAELGPLGLSATLSYLAGLTMIVLLAGFVSTDRRRGYAHLFLSHPVNPLALYGLRVALAAVLAMCAAVLFLILGQWIGWGEFRGGWGGLGIPLLAVVVWGGVMSLLSTALPRGDAWVALAMFLPTFFPQVLFFAQRALAPAGYQLLLFLLPPQWAFQDVYLALLKGAATPWGAVAYIAGYGVVWLGVAGVLLRVREWK